MYPRVGVDDRARARYGGPMAQLPLTLRRRKRVEYERLVDLGVFEGDPVELIGGELVVAEPQGSPHAPAPGAAGGAPRGGRPPRGGVGGGRGRGALDDEWAPEPARAVGRGARADYRAAHPPRPALALE